MSTTDKIPHPVCALLAEAFRRQQMRQQTGQDRQSGLDKVPAESVTVPLSPCGEKQDEQQETQDGRR